VLETLLLLAITVALPLLGASPLQIVLVMVLWLAVSWPGIRLMMRGAPPMIPTQSSRVRAMMDLADLRPGETAYDLGCGDGRLVFAAAERGANAVGYEYSLPTFLLAKLRGLGRQRVAIRFGDFWSKGFGDADVVFCYLHTDVMPAFCERIWPRLRPGTRVITNTFRLPEQTPKNSVGSVHLYVR
jgi:SAM-dependent methyltransferase